MESKRALVQSMRHLTPPIAPASRGGPRPWQIHSAFLFTAISLLDELGRQGVKVGVAASVRKTIWQAAMLYPHTHNPAYVLSGLARSQLRPPLDNRPTLGALREGLAPSRAPSEGRTATVVRPTTPAARPVQGPRAWLAPLHLTQPTTKRGEPRTVSPKIAPKPGSLSEICVSCSFAAKRSPTCARAKDPAENNPCRILCR